MRAKKFRVIFQSVNETLDQFEKDWKVIQKGGKPSRLVATDEPFLMIDYPMFPKIFSTERLRIIHTIQEKHPVSVSALAEILGREQANVHRDVHFLAEFGILDLKRVKEEGKPENVKPEFNWAGFEIEIENKKNKAA